MIERNAYSLKLAQSVPLELKIIQTKKKIQEFLDNYPAYISFSGGKDSMVMMTLIKEVDSSVPVVFCDTGMEYPSVRENGLKYADVVLRPKMPFNKVIEKYGYPVISKETSQKISDVLRTKSDKLRNKRLGKGSGSLSECWKFLLNAPFKISDRCCFKLKKEPFKKYEKESGNFPFVGVLAEESKLRQQSWVKFGCNAFDGKRPQGRPLMLWTEEQVFEFIKDRNIKLPKIYERVSRTGCMFCMFGYSKTEEDKFELIRELYPEVYNYFWNKLNFKEIVQFIYGGTQLRLKCFNNG